MAFEMKRDLIIMAEKKLWCNYDGGKASQKKWEGGFVEGMLPCCVSNESCVQAHIYGTGGT